MDALPQGTERHRAATACPGEAGMPPPALHRLDWRFLLPAPPPGGCGRLVLLGGTTELADAARAVGLAREVELELPAGREADAVVLLAGAGTSPEEAAARLAPGGALHWEVGRRRPLASPSVARRLAASGLSVVGTWAALPGFDPCRMYLPLGGPGALAWWLESYPAAATPFRRLTGLALGALLRSRRIAWHLVRRFGWHLAVTAVAGPLAPGRESVAALAGLPPGLRRPGLQALVLKDTVKRAGTRAVVLAFPAGGDRPVAVLKVPKLPALAGRTENEQAVLAGLAAMRPRLSPELARALPRPLGLDRSCGVPVGVEEPLAGRPLHAGRVEDLDLAAGWLAAFHAETRLGVERWGPESAARWVEAPLEALAREAPPSAAAADLFTAARARAAALVGTPLPIVRQHRDFTVWNLLRTPDGLGVLDWEGCRPGLPLCDLFHLAATWHRPARGANPLRELFVEPERGGAGAAAVGRAVERYRSRLAIDRRFVPLLLVLTWVELALRRIELRRDFGGGAAGAGDEPRAALDILAAGALRLFGGHA